MQTSVGLLFACSKEVKSFRKWRLHNFSKTDRDLVIELPERSKTRKTSRPSAQDLHHLGITCGTVPWSKLKSDLWFLAIPYIILAPTMDDHHWPFLRGMLQFWSWHTEASAAGFGRTATSRMARNSSASKSFSSGSQFDQVFRSSLSIPSLQLKFMLVPLSFPHPGPQCYFCSDSARSPTCSSAL